MEKMIAYCGLRCDMCPTFLATQENDDKKREKVAEQWSKQFGMNLAAQDINCDGCKSFTGKLFGHCSNCEIKKCCSEKKMDNCASCDNYACKILNVFFEFAPHAKDCLEKLRKNM